MKKFIATLLLGAFLFTGAVSTIGCGKEDDKKKDADKKKADDKKADDKKAS